jgi:hypothetical protein
MTVPNHFYGHALERLDLAPRPRVAGGTLGVVVASGGCQRQGSRCQSLRRRSRIICGASRVHTVAGHLHSFVVRCQRRSSARAST